MRDVLVVEDEPAIAELIAVNLRHAGFGVRLAGNAGQAQELVNARLPQLVIMDWMLPGESGVALLRRWRADSRTRELPIVMLTARTQEHDLVAGLDAGADDYLTKPFSIVELVARMRALLRRRLPEALDSVVTAGPLRLDPATRRVFKGDVEVRVPGTEFRLLRHFMLYPERVHTRAALLDRVWGDHVFIEERTVDVHIKRLRDALSAVGAAELIDTVRGAGYRLTLSQATPATN
jgi:two-component system phosphate regulon response regulator PhoB